MSEGAIGPRQSAELVKLLSDESAQLDLLGRLMAVRRAICGRIVFTTSFGIEDQTITHVTRTNELDIEVVTLDTGRLFPETLEVWGETERRYRQQIRGLSPDRENVEALVSRDGVNGFRDSLEARVACCAVRKIEPLGRALTDGSAWITGLRMGQSALRARVPYASFDSRYRLVKVNPLFDWSRDRVVAFVRDNRIPYNTLHDRGFLSIGCAPCTRAVAPGEPERAGRWWWEREGKSECGLHPTHPACRPSPA